MKNLMRVLLVVIAILHTSSVAYAQVSGNIELELTRARGDTKPEVNVYAHGPLAHKFGWTFWAQSDEYWGEAIAGPTFAPTKWMEVSFQVGVEQNNDPLRYAETVWLGSGKWSFLTIQENGGSGRWQKSVGVYQLNNTFSLGVLHQAFIGAGPYAEIRVGKLTFWEMYAVKEHRGLFTTRFNF